MILAVGSMLDEIEPDREKDSINWGDIFFIFSTSYIKPVRFNYFMDVTIKDFVTE